MKRMPSMTEVFKVRNEGLWDRITGRSKKSAAATGPSQAFQDAKQKIKDEFQKVIFVAISGGGVDDSEVKKIMSSIPHGSISEDEMQELNKLVERLKAAADESAAQVQKGRDQADADIKNRKSQERSSGRDKEEYEWREGDWRPRRSGEQSDFGRNYNIPYVPKGGWMNLSDL